MSRVASRSFKVSFVALMIATTAVFELINRVMPLRVPWGMSIDFVALPVLITFFILGTRYAIVAALGMYGILLVFGFAGLIGATMKFMATVPMVLVLGGLLLTPLRNTKIPTLTYHSLPRYIVASALAIIARCTVAVALNYYWAIPLFFGMPVGEVIQNFFGSTWFFVTFISVMNITQGIIDLAVSWIIVFGFGISKRFLTNKNEVSIS